MTMIDGVRFDPDDLPRFAGDLYDRVRAGADLPPVSAEAAALLAGSGGGAVDTDTFDPVELLAYVLAVVGAEASLPDGAFTERVDAAERRLRVEEAVRRLVGYRS
jgi:hypothetical protein